MRAPLATWSLCFMGAVCMAPTMRPRRAARNGQGSSGWAEKIVDVSGRDQSPADGEVSEVLPRLEIDTVTLSELLAQSLKLVVDRLRGRRPTAPGEQSGDLGGVEKVGPEAFRSEPGRAERSERIAPLVG